MVTFEWLCICVLLVGCGLVIGYNLKQDSVTYGTNLSKFEIMYENCMSFRSATVSDCESKAEDKAKTCTSGCE